MPPRSRATGSDEQTTVRVDGRQLAVTNLDKVLYPETGTTKAEVLRYYAIVAPALLPVLEGRPVTRKRWPHGVASDPFFVKNLEPGAPSWITRETLPHSDGPVTYPLVDSPAVLTWMAQMAALELHVPQWRFHGHLPDRPDRMVFDLDPGPGIGLPACAEVALLLREMLQQTGSDAVPVTSGSKGIHLYVPLDGRRTSDEVSTVAKAVAEALQAQRPRTVTSRMAKALRDRKIFLDWSQNSAAKTTIAPYSLRGRAAPTVAAPRTWEEIADPALRQLDLDEVLERVRGGDDPWGEFFAAPDGTELDRELDEDGDRPAPVADPGRAEDRRNDARAAAAAYAMAAMQSRGSTGGEGKVVKYGSHRWADPNEGPRGRVVRRDLTQQREKAPRPEVTRAAGSAQVLPMAAVAGTAVGVTGGQWRYEGKWDGIRAIAEIDAMDEGRGTLRLIGRSGRDLTGGYPELVELIELVDGHRVVVDGEIVTLDGDGRTSFPRLQQRMNVNSPTPRLIRSVPVRYFAFDVLEVDGVSLQGKAHDDRRRVLEALGLAGDHVEVPGRIDGPIEAALRFTGEQGWEGVIAKRGDSLYRPGTRSADWVKIKHQRAQEIVVIGWRRGGGRRTGGIGSLLMAVPDDDGALVYCGRVGTGFTDAALAALEKQLGDPVDQPAAEVPREDVKDAVWVRPELVGEVAFLEWTPDGRLRAPTWRGVRPDKDPADVRRES
ncbi:MAG: non-homologous end-joining DNA ligase [Nakamurella sp.]